MNPGRKTQFPKLDYVDKLPLPLQLSNTRERTFIYLYVRTIANNQVTTLIMRNEDQLKKGPKVKKTKGPKRKRSTFNRNTNVATSKRKQGNAKFRLRPSDRKREVMTGHMKDQNNWLWKELKNFDIYGRGGSRPGRRDTWRNICTKTSAGIPCR